MNGAMIKSSHTATVLSIELVLVKSVMIKFTHLTTVLSIELVLVKCCEAQASRT